MSKVRRKITKYEIILCVLVLAVIVAGLLLPKTGELVLLDEFCNISVISITHARAPQTDAGSLPGPCRADGVSGRNGSTAP